MHKILAAATALLLAHCGATPLAALEERQSCPNVHVFGARETTAPAGYGTSSVVVNLVLNAYPGSTSEAINYPAWYGRSQFDQSDDADSHTVADNRPVARLAMRTVLSRASLPSPPP